MLICTPGILSKNNQVNGSTDNISTYFIHLWQQLFIKMGKFTLNEYIL